MQKCLFILNTELAAKVIDSARARKFFMLQNYKGKLVGCSRGFGEDGELDFERVETFVTVGHHAEVVSRPKTDGVDGTVAAHPTPVALEVVHAEHIHVVDLPSEAVAVAIVPGAVTTALLGPQVDHLTHKVRGVRKGGGHTEGEGHEEELDPVVVKIVVRPQEEALVLQESVKCTVSDPEDPLVRKDWESTSEQVVGALFDGNS